MSEHIDLISSVLENNNLHDHAVFLKKLETELIDRRALMEEMKELRSDQAELAKEKYEHSKSGSELLDQAIALVHKRDDTISSLRLGASLCLIGWLGTWAHYLYP